MLDGGRLLAEELADGALLIPAHGGGGDLIANLVPSPVVRAAAGLHSGPRFVVMAAVLMKRRCGGYREEITAEHGPSGYSA
jgi:hypothetical protein